jgi:phosphonopyruvate decarboxylase
MSVDPLYFFNELKKHQINFFTGVPDSLLKQFCLCVEQNVSKRNHIIAANEGNAVAIGAGYHISSGLIPLIYMQNSGLGNAINPLLSLCDPKVYSIPMLIMVGWRGEPGIPDEPQHVKQGQIQTELLSVLGIDYEVISGNDQNISKKLSRCISIATKKERPVAILIRKKTFSEFKIPNLEPPIGLMSREEVLEKIIKKIPNNSVIVSTTGKTSREIFEIRKRLNQSHEKDFLTVGSMGHCSSIALGIALQKPDRKVFCIDGDGSLIMHLGSLPIIGQMKPKNFFHILLNNFAHESVGGQKTAAEHISISDLVKANSYKNVYLLSKEKNFTSEVNKFFKESGPNFLEIKIKIGSRKDLGRPTINPVDNKKSFMAYLKD